MNIQRYVAVFQVSSDNSNELDLSYGMWQITRGMKSRDRLNPKLQVHDRSVLEPKGEYIGNNNYPQPPNVASLG
jgi:hypothetical protein